MLDAVIHSRAQRILDRLPKKQARQIFAAIERVAKNPWNDPHLAPLHGEFQGFHRIRVGNFRVIVQIATTEELLLVISVGPRGDVYK